MTTKIDGTWHNEHGSELDLRVLDDSRLVGRFRSGTGLARGECEVIGFVSGNLVAFTANLGASGSLTSWVGHLVEEDGGLRIHTSWNMCVALPGQEADALWRGTWTGADTFDAGPAPEVRRQAPKRQASHAPLDWPPSARSFVSDEQ